MDSFDFEMAGLFCQRALDVDSNNLQALDMQGHIYSELGDTQKAKGISFVQVSCWVHVSNSHTYCCISMLFEGSDVLLCCGLLDPFSLKFFCVQWS